MARNPLFQNGFYFFSGMYDDTIILDLYKKLQREDYSQSKNIQDFTIGRRIPSENTDPYIMNSNGLLYHKTLNQFVVDTTLNAKLSIPEDSMSIVLDDFTLPYFNKKRFIDKYGVSMTLIPLVDLYTETGIFDKYVKVFIGPYRLARVHFTILENGKTALVIIASNILGISTTGFTNLINTLGNADVYLKLEPQTVAYSGTITSAANITNSIDSAYKIITLNKSSMLSENISYGASQSNAWNVLLTYNASLYGQRILACSSAVQDGSTNTTISFKVPAVFINHILLNQTSMNILLEKCPHLKETYRYDYNNAILPILSIHCNENAIGISNISIFKYDSQTAMKKEYIPVPKSTPRYFPNIFNLTDIIGTNNVVIEITEYPSSFTNQSLRNPIEKMISSIANDNKYAEAILNGYLYSENNENHNPLLTYSPQISSISSNDYRNGEYFGDFRGYVLNKLESAILTDGSIYTEYLKLMEKVNKTTYTSSGTPKDMGFGGSLRGGEFTGINPVVLDTSFISQNPDDILHFTEPHSYIKYYSENKPIPCNVYINGEYNEPTVKRFYRGYNYIFFPVSKMNSYMNSANFPNEQQVKACRPITVEIYPNAYDSKIKTPKETILISDGMTPLKFFDTLDKSNIALSDITLVNVDTNEFLDLFDNFKIGIDIDLTTLKTPDVTDVVATHRGEGVQYLLTVLNELYKTMDLNEIIVADVTRDSISLNDFVESISTLPQFAGLSIREILDLFSHKKLNLDNVTFTPISNNLIGATIEISLNTYRDRNIITGDMVTSTDNNTHIATFTIAHTDNDAKKYQMYVNGRYCPSEIGFTDNIYGSGVVVEFPDTFTYTSDDVFSLIHSPVEKTLINWIPYRKASTEDDSYEVQLYYMSNEVNATGASQKSIWPAKTSLNSGIFVVPNLPEDSPVYDYFPTPPLSQYLFNDDSVSLFTSDGYRLYTESESTDVHSIRYYSGDVIANTRVQDAMLSGDINDRPNNSGLVKVVDCTFTVPSDNILREICNTVMQ